MVDFFKKHVGLFKMRQDAKKLNRQIKDPNIHRNSRIGILYDATERETFEEVREFFRDLRNDGHKPHLLGYVDFKEITFHPLARPENDYFLKSQLNWMNIPSGIVVDNFIRDPFDMLINLTVKDFFPIDYIAATSHAGLKIGRAESAVAYCYDLSFYMGDTADIKSFAYTIIHYLSQINHEKKI